MEQAQREFREWLCRGSETAGEQRLRLEIVEGAEAWETSGSRTVALQLSANGIPVFWAQQEAAAGTRLEEAQLWRQLAEALAAEWELPEEAKSRLLAADFYF